jgi:hypothetical protein
MHKKERQREREREREREYRQASLRPSTMITKLPKKEREREREITGKLA